jgi:hypothetical protein
VAAFSSFRPFFSSGATETLAFFGRSFWLIMHQRGGNNDALQIPHATSGIFIFFELFLYNQQQYFFW